jgi:putative endonuclease
LTVTGPGFFQRSSLEIFSSAKIVTRSSRDFLCPNYTYILKSLKDEGYYYGHTSDIEKRLKKHNTKKVRSTKSRVPFMLHYHEIFQTKSEAYVQEMYFKSIEGKKYLREKGIL